MSRKSRSPRARARLSFESLEDRSLLAGNVFAAISGVSLIVTGDASDNAIDINAVAGFPGRVTITPQAGTTLNGQTATLTFPSFGDTRIFLGGGADTLNYIGDPGSSDSLPGTLSISGGEGDNTIAISDYDVGGSVLISNGSGTDAVTLTNTHAVRDIIISNGSSGAILQTTSLLEGTSAGADVRLTALNGSSSVTLDGAVPVSVGRNLAISNLGAGPADTATVSLDNTTIGGNLTIQNRPAATVTIGGSESGPVTVTRSTWIQNLATSGGNNVEIGNSSSFGSVAGDRFSILNGPGGLAGNTVLLNNITINANSDIRSGNGDATITASGATSFNGSLNIGTGFSGTHTIDIQDGVILGNLTIYNAVATSNTVSIGTNGTVAVSGLTSINNNNATTNTVNVLDASFTRAVTIVNATGIDAVAFGNAGLGTVTADSYVAIYNGNGASTSVDIDGLTATGSLTIRNTSTGTHAINVGVNSPSSTGSVSITAGAGDVTVTLDQLTITGNLLLLTGAGADTVNLADAGAAGLSVSGTTTANTGAGADNLFIGNSTGTATLTGYLNVQMGYGADNVTIGANMSNVGTAIGTGFFSFDGGVDPVGSNVITVNTSVIDPFVDLATYNKFKRFVIITIP